jgi:hypothetical protein
MLSPEKFFMQADRSAELAFLLQQRLPILDSAMETLDLLLNELA